MKIKKLFPLEQIHWVPGPENPADFGTRPKTVQEMVEYTSWAKGPNFLYSHESKWPRLPALERTKEVMEEVKKEYKLFSQAVVLSSRTSEIEVAQKDPFAAENYRSFAKMIRVVAFMIKFCRKCKLRIDKRKAGQNVPALTLAQKGSRKVVKYE